MLVLFTASSCKAYTKISKPVSDNSDSDTSIVTDQPSQNEKPDSKPAEKPKPAPKSEYVEFFGQLYQVAPHKEEFTVVLIMPFYFDAETDLEKRTAGILLDYYMGLKLALKHLEENGIKLKLQVYDNRNDTTELKHILWKKEISKADVIIGPLMEEQMEIVRQYGARQNIPVFSPLSAINQPVNGYQGFQFYYASSPNLESRAKSLVQFWATRHAGKKVLIIRDDQPFEKQFVPILINELKKAGIKYTEEKHSNKSNLSVSLSATDTTLVYIPTFQSGVVNTALGKIYSTKRNVIVFGENNWKDFEDNDYNFWEKLRVHLIATDYIDYSSPEVSGFRREFRDSFVNDPGLYAFLGYDQMRFIGDFLMAFGEHFPMFINGRDFRYLCSSYKFENRAGVNQNTHMFILKFADLQLHVVE